MPKLVTPSAAARILGGDKPISIRTLAFWRKQGTGPEHVKVGRSYRYTEEGLRRFLEQNTCK
jgi:hypothetical protein